MHYPPLNLKSIDWLTPHWFSSPQPSFHNPLNLSKEFGKIPLSFSISGADSSIDSHAYKTNGKTPLHYSGEYGENELGSET